MNTHRIQSEDKIHADHSGGSNGLPQRYTTQEEADQATEHLKLAQKEDKAVRCLGVAVIAILVASAVVLSVGCGIFLRRAEHQQFRESFEANADKVVDSVYLTIQSKMEALDTLSASFTSFAKATGATWPNVTLPDYAVRAAGIRALADTPLVSTYHLVTDESREGWEAYSSQNQRELYNRGKASEIYQRSYQDSLFMQPSTPFPEESFTPFSGVIYDLNVENGTAGSSLKGSGPYFPGWQNSPWTPFQSVVNLNVLSYPGARASVMSVVNSHKASLDQSVNTANENLGSTGAYLRSVLSLGQYRYDIDDVVTDPSAGLYYPVFDSFIKEEQTVVAIIAISVLWKLYFTDILPSTAKGIVCVMSNSLGQRFTYRIDGGKATYLGEGDHHETSFDFMRKGGLLSDYKHQTRVAKSLSFTSVDIVDQFEYQIDIFPSVDTQEMFLTIVPWIAGLVVAIIFIFTGLVFGAYSFFVNRRQGILMRRAIASGTIVSSLFPSRVRDQLYRENERTHAFDQAGNELRDGGVPIADKFESTSIIFADLKGFTQWSSDRCPEDVFVLLETLYGAFDKIAFRRKVFKVETIGDCYVAITGLPHPQVDHAVIMCRFAEECMAKLSALVRTELPKKLGPDTQHLMLRVGIHSGPVTAGVLRGIKGRFQLFGDSVNVASRMESTGQGGRIQISESTKNELIAHGKASWVVPRDDIVQLKGKGKAQTYWLLPTSTAKQHQLSSRFPSVHAEVEDFTNRSTFSL